MKRITKQIEKLEETRQRLKSRCTSNLRRRLIDESVDEHIASLKSLLNIKNEN